MRPVLLACRAAAVGLLVLASVSVAQAQQQSDTAPNSAAAGNDSANMVALPRIASADPLNGGFLIANQHGMLFHDLTADAAEDITYARWLGAGIIRVFATDNNGFRALDGRAIGNRIADRAPMLRAANMRLIVALINNHRAVPGEPAQDIGWMDNYIQLLLPFYTQDWRIAYLPFVRDLISTVQARGALDVIYAWELGNELHTPRDPPAVIPFITQAVQEVRALDPRTPILPGTMGANHVQPGNRTSPIARWLYCEAPVDAYTLHAYDWISRDRGGDMPIDWDLDNIVSQPCDSGRQLPVIVEELGTSRSLAGLYTADDETSRLAQERRQIDFVRQFAQVVGFGVWNAESPRLVDRTFVDTRRGLTSYGANAQGGGSCYDPQPELQPAARCSLEQVLRGLHFVRPGLAAAWLPGPDTDVSNPLQGSVSVASDGTTLNGWAIDPSAQDSTGVSGVDLYLGSALVAQAQMGLSRPDGAASADNPAWAQPGFSVSLPLDTLPTGANSLTLVARTPRGTWLSNVQVVIPSLGGVVAARVIPAPAAPVPTLVPSEPVHLEVAAPAPGASVGRSFLVQGVATGADRVDIFMEPDRDGGGALVGSGVPGELSPGTRLGRPLGTAEFLAPTTVPRGGHTLYVHAHTASGQETVLVIPVTVS